MPTIARVGTRVFRKSRYKLCSADPLRLESAALRGRLHFAEMFTKFISEERNFERNIFNSF